MGRFKYRATPLILDNRGQSTVEYILLFAVVISIVTAVLRSQRFKEIFGDDGKFATVYKNEIEFTYRNTYLDRKPFSTPNYQSNNQDSYVNRFFIPKNNYPQ